MIYCINIRVVIIVLIVTLSRVYAVDDIIKHTSDQFKGNVIILNGPPCVGKSTTATVIKKILTKSKIVRADKVSKKACITFGTQLGLFTNENPKGPDNKYGYQGLACFMQYVQEHHQCTMAERAELFNLQLKPFQKIIDLVNEGYTVIFDGTVTQANKRFYESIQMLKEINVTFVLLYMPFEDTIKRYAQSGRRSHGILHVLGYNFPWFYKLQDKKDEPVLIESSYQQLMSLISNLDATIPPVLRQRCAEEISKRFELQDEQNVLLVSRLKHDLMINVENISAHNCAKKIVEYADVERETRSKFFENEFLPMPSNKETLAIVPKLSLKYLS